MILTLIFIGVFIVFLALMILAIIFDIGDCEVTGPIFGTIMGIGLIGTLITGGMCLAVNQPAYAKSEEYRIKEKIKLYKNEKAVLESYHVITDDTGKTTFTSDIRLLTTSDTANKISIRVSNGTNSVNGLITGYDYNKNYLKVEGISNTEKVGPDYFVYTSGLGGIYPSGILIGTVTNIKTDEYDLAKIIDVTPIADFNDINYVAILKRKEVSE